MTVLILGVALWWAAHLFKRLAPSIRAPMGDRGKMYVSVALLVSVVLMVIGYRSASEVPLWTPLPGIGHLNNLLMLVSAYLFAVGGTKSTLYTKMRHPMLWGGVLWAVAHLLVNGDLASLVLFGGIGLWAIVAIVMIDRADPWQRPTDGRGFKGDAMNLVAALAVYGVIAGIHTWLGYSPFLGTYG